MEQFNLQVATLIKADGETKELTPNNGKKFTYEEVRNAIGNYIELIDLRYYTKDNEEDAKKFVDLLCKSEQLDFIKYSISQTLNY